MAKLNTLLTLDGGFITIDHPTWAFTYLPIKLHLKPIVGQEKAGWLVLVGPRTMCTMISNELHERIHYKSTKIIEDLIRLKNEVPGFNYCFITDDGSAWTYGSVHLVTGKPGDMKYVEATDNSGVCFGPMGIDPYTCGGITTPLELIENLIINQTTDNPESSKDIRIIHRTEHMLSEIKLGDLRRKYNVGSDLEDHAVVPTSAFKG